jgi:hypothetical protein
MSPGSELNDRGVYRIAVGAIGLALIVVLVGLCVIVALGFSEKEIPQGLWTAASALAGGLLGLLAPQPTPPSAAKSEGAGAQVGGGKAFAKKAAGVVTIIVKDAWENRTVIVLLAIFGVSVGFGVAENSGQLQALAAASGAALVGLLAPAPGASKKSADG